MDLCIITTVAFEASFLAHMYKLLVRFEHGRITPHLIATMHADVTRVHGRSDADDVIATACQSISHD